MAFVCKNGEIAILETTTSQYEVIGNKDTDLLRISEQRPPRRNCCGSVQLTLKGTSVLIDNRVLDGEGQALLSRLVKENLAKEEEKRAWAKRLMKSRFVVGKRWHFTSLIAQNLQSSLNQVQQFASPQMLRSQHGAIVRITIM